MFLAQLLVKVPHVQIEVLVPVEPQDLFSLRLRHSPATWLPLSPVQQSLVALFFEALPPSTHLPLADAHQLRWRRSSNPWWPCPSKRFRHRRICRSLMPISSAGAGPAIPGGLVLRSASAIDASAAR